MLSSAAARNALTPLADFLAQDPKQLKGEALRMWYVHAWALHAFLMSDAPEDDRTRFADWQTALERMKPKPGEVDELGRRLFLAQFGRDQAEFEARFLAWVRSR